MSTPIRRPPAPSDTAPATPEDQRVAYPTPQGATGVCRVRVYRPEAKPVVILVTELADNPAASVTNSAETAYYAAWITAGQPAPCVFVEHYPGEPGRAAPFGEHFDETRFPLAPDGDGPYVGSERGTGAFGEPAWRRLSREAFLALIA